MKALPTAANDTERGQLETSSWFAVVRAYLECSKQYTEMLAHFDLTVTQYDVLTAIEHLGDDALPKAIAQRLVVTRANITGVVKRLQERELVSTVEHADDGRSFVCVLTRSGQRLLRKTHAAAKRFVGAQLAPFTSDELEQTRSLMQAMNSHLKTLDPAALANNTSRPRPARQRAGGQ